MCESKLEGESYILVFVVLSGIVGGMKEAIILVHGEKSRNSYRTLIKISWKEATHKRMVNMRE